MSEISVRSGEFVINRWTTYSIDTDMLAPADGFNLTIAPVAAEVYDLVAPDAPVEIRVDDNPIITGIVDTRNATFARDGTLINITGRDKVGRMVDSSAELQTFGTQDIRTLAQSLASPEFDTVAVSNDDNRRLLRGRRAGIAPTYGPPEGQEGPAALAIGPLAPEDSGAAGVLVVQNIDGIFAPSKAPKKVEPGETRWQVLQQFLEPESLLAWSSASGQELIITTPNYNQGVQYRFFVPAAGSVRAREGNVIACSIHTSNAERYGTIRVTGSSKGNSKNYGKRVTKHTATVVSVRDGDGFHEDGASDFTSEKLLIVSDPDVKNEEDAGDRAQREILLRDAERLVVELEVEGHNQRRTAADGPALYAYDTLCDLHVEEIGLRGVFLITAVNFTVSKSGGEVTRMKMVPKGTPLTT